MGVFLSGVSAGLVTGYTIARVVYFDLEHEDVIEQMKREQELKCSQCWRRRDDYEKN